MLSCLKSVVPSIIFPALVNQTAAQQLALQYQFEQNQWRNGDTIVNDQFKQLQNLLFFAQKNSPFWQKRFKEKELDTQWIKNLTPASFSQLAPLKRGELQQEINQIKTLNPPKEHGPLNEAKSSGSTGTPVITFGTSITQLFWDAFSIREHLWHRRDFSLTLAAIRSLPKDEARAPLGLVSKGWGNAVSRVFEAGPSVLLNVDEPIHRQYKWLLKHNPDYLVTHPSNLMALAWYASQQSKKLTKLKQIRTVGETVSPQLRKAVKVAFNCDIADMYSCQESGYIAIQCLEKENYHVMSEGVYVEVVDIEGQPVKVGQQGKVLITNLNNFATPLIRYELGDMAIMGEPCTCGRGLPVIERILGRTRNMLILPDGSIKWPYLSYSLFVKEANIQQFQVIQHSLKLVELCYVSQKTANKQQQLNITEILQRTLGHTFEIKLTRIKEIKRSKSGKHEDFISHVSYQT